MTQIIEKQDSFKPLVGYEAVCSGNIIDKLKWVEENQLTDPVLWSLFVNQFRYHTDTDNAWRGEYWGKTMRGACLTYSYTKNEKLYEILEATVKDLLTTQESSGRISAYPVELEFNGWDMWGRKYVLLGLQYFLEICKDKSLVKKIITAMCKSADYIIARIGNSEDKITITDTSLRVSGVNSSSILEPMVRLYKLTGNKKYLNFAEEIIDNGGVRGFDIFEAALEGKLYPFEYPETKAYEMISCFEGIVEYYRVTGEEKYKTMAINFAKLVFESDVTVIGCAGLTDEFFDNARAKQIDPQYKNRQETCVTVTWMKFCYQLLRLTGESKYADLIENSAYNALLGAVNVKNNKSENGQIFPFDSYSPVLNGVRGTIVGGWRDIIHNRFWWGCCVSIGSAGTALPPNMAIMSTEKGLAVNLFIAGEYKVKIENKPVTIKIETDYPKNGNIKITVLAEEKTEFPFNIRIPAWSKETELKINGESVYSKCGEYAVMEKVGNGDVIEMCLDMRTEIITAQSIDPNASPEALCHIALRRGPIMLARDSALEADITAAVSITENGCYADIEVCEAPEDYEQCFNVKCKDGSKFPVADYASCGQIWDENKPITVWITTK